MTDDGDLPKTISPEQLEFLESVITETAQACEAMFTQMYEEGTDEQRTEVFDAVAEVLTGKYSSGILTLGLLQVVIQILHDCGLTDTQTQALFLQIATSHYHFRPKKLDS